jgi:hypothetical protein
MAGGPSQIDTWDPKPDRPLGEAWFGKNLSVDFVRRQIRANGENPQKRQAFMRRYRRRRTAESAARSMFTKMCWFTKRYQYLVRPRFSSRGVKNHTH